MFFGTWFFIFIFIRNIILILNYRTFGLHIFNPIFISTLFMWFQCWLRLFKNIKADGLFGENPLFKLVNVESEQRMLTIKIQIRAFSYLWNLDVVRKQFLWKLENNFYNHLVLQPLLKKQLQRCDRNLLTSI